MTEPVRIGVLSTARIVRQAILEAAAETPEVRLVAVASRDLERAQAYASAHGFDRAYGGYMALLADPEVEVVYNPLPNSLHMTWSIAALEAGKAVLCEKPLASNAAESAEIVAAAQRTGGRLIEAFHYRHHPMARAIIERVHSGVIGEIRELRATLKVPRSLMADDDIRFDPTLAGGATMDLGVYGVNLLRAVAGKEPTVSAARATPISASIDGAMTVELAFPGDVRAELSCSLIHDGFLAQFWARGTRGELTADNPFLPQLGNRLTVTVGGETTTERFDRTTTYVHQLRALAATVRGGAPTLTPGADGVRTMQVVDEIYRASWLGVRGTLTSGVRD